MELRGDDAASGFDDVDRTHGVFVDPHEATALVGVDDDRGIVDVFDCAGKEQSYDVNDLAADVDGPFTVRTQLLNRSDEAGLFFDFALDATGDGLFDVDDAAGQLVAAGVAHGCFVGLPQHKHTARRILDERFPSDVSGVFH